MTEDRDPPQEPDPAADPMPPPDADLPSTPLPGAHEAPEPGDDEAVESSAPRAVPDDLAPARDDDPIVKALPDPPPPAQPPSSSLFGPRDEARLARAGEPAAEPVPEREPERVPAGPPMVKARPGSPESRQNAAEAARRARAHLAAEAARRRRGDTLDPRQPSSNATVHRAPRRHAAHHFDDDDAAASGPIWPRLLAVAAVVVIVAAGAFLIAKGSGSHTDTTIVHRTVTTTATKPPAKQQKAPTTASAPAGIPKGFVRYSGSAYSAIYPKGWKLVENNVPISGGYDETRFLSPDGSSEVDIDRTPTDPDSPEQAATSVRTAVSSESGYRELAFAKATLAGAPAWRWEFSAPASGRIGLSGVHVDFFRRLGGGRFATLAVGAYAGPTRALDARVAASIVLK